MKTATGLFILGALFFIWPTSVATAQINSNWTNASGGNWTDAANWSSSSFPNNGGGDTYNALLNLVTGTPYQVSLFSNIEVENLTIDSADTTLLQRGVTLQANQGIDINAGTFRLENGIILNSTINLNGGQFAFTGAFGPSSFRNVTFNGDLNVPRNELVYLYDGTSVNGDILVSDSTLGFAGFDAGSRFAVDVSAGRSIALDNGRLETFGTVDFTIKSGASVSGEGIIRMANGDAEFVNEGTVHAVKALTVSGFTRATNNGTMMVDSLRSITFSGETVVNNGTITGATDSTVTMGGKWDNTNGVINVDGTLQLRGEFITSNIGTINAAEALIAGGTWDNTGHTSDLSEFGGGDVYLTTSNSPSVIRGGVIDNSAQRLKFAKSNFYNTHVLLDNVAITGGVNMRPATGTSPAHVRLINGATIDGDLLLDQSDVISVDGTAVAFDVNGTIHLSGFSKFGTSGDSRLTIGPNTTIRGGGILKTDVLGVGNAAIINQGNLLADQFTTSLETDFFENQGLIEISNGRELRIQRTQGSTGTTMEFVQTAGATRLNNGTLSAIAFSTNDITAVLNFQDGRLEGNGLIRGEVMVGGTLAVGLSTGLLESTDGDFTLLDSATSEFEIGGLNQGAMSNGYDFLDVDGMLALDGDLQIGIVDGFENTIDVGNLFRIMRSGSGLTGQFNNVANGGLLNTFDNQYFFSVHYGTGSLFNQDQVVLVFAGTTGVPEPIAILPCALCCGFLMSRRRRINPEK